MIFNLFGKKNKKESPSVFASLKTGLQKTRERLHNAFSSLLGITSLDITTRDKLLRTLISCDIGPETAEYVLVETEKKLRSESDMDANQALRAVLSDILAPSDTDWTPPNEQPAVLLFVGVNGSGKTTSIGRIGHNLKKHGKRVVMAAGDTFRAAAIDQLKSWGDRSSIQVVAHSQGSDSAAVLFEAMQVATAQKADILLGDTAGRLHTKNNLMQELAKVRKVIQKHNPNAPHETWLVLDATVGQNGLKQAEEFQKSVSVTGVVLTKLDGTAKGGIVFAISKQLGLPVRFVGVGEKETDLLPFDKHAFIDALLSNDDKQ
tara:strand:- start:939 stop:1895 length:957 start_codon:yes stop_codon:yes gene_type:complete